VSGYPDNTFKPGKEINLVEALKIIFRAYDFGLAEGDDVWYENYLEFANDNNLLFKVDIGTGDLVDRGQMAQIIFNVENYLNGENVGVTYPLELSLSGGEIYTFENGMTLKVNNIFNGGMNFYLFSDYENGIYYPDAFEILRVEPDLLNSNILSRDGVYVYLDSIVSGSNGHEANIEIYDSVEDFYELCLEVRGNDKICLYDVARYGPVDSSFSKVSDGMFNVVYPNELKGMADLTLEVLPGCYNAYSDLFGSPQDISSLTVFFYYPDSNSESVGAYSDAIIVPIHDYFIDRYRSFSGSDYECATGFFPLAHEMVHIFDNGGMQYPGLKEGFANYVSRRYDYFGVDIECDAGGYQLYYKESGDYSDYVVYPEDPGEDPYKVGECFFRRLEDNYGVSKVNDLILDLGESRNVSSNGEYTFFDDLVEPIFGSGALEIGDAMNYDLSCRAEIPLRGYTCDSFY